MHKKLLALLACLPLLLLLMFPTAHAYWWDLEDVYGPTININLLVCYDPEFAGLNNNHLWDSHACLEQANEYFAATFGIEFIFDIYHDWLLWDSYEAPYYLPDDLLEDAIEKTGFESGKVINGKVRDMLLALTGKEILGGMGWRWPPWDACIVEWNVFSGQLDEMFQHELCIFVLDCPDPDCVMNAGMLSHLDPPNCWCENCFHQINSKKFSYTVVGDVNGDHLVNSIDLNHAETRVGYRKEDEDWHDTNWAPSCDINGNHAIDTDDVSIISDHLGQIASGYSRLALSQNLYSPYTSLSPGAGDYAYPNGYSVAVTATVDRGEGYIFCCFSLDGEGIAENPLTVVMNSDHTVIAYFKETGGGGTGGKTFEFQT